MPISVASEWWQCAACPAKKVARHVEDKDVTLLRAAPASQALWGALFGGYQFARVVSGEPKVAGWAVVASAVLCPPCWAKFQAALRDALGIELVEEGEFAAMVLHTL